MIEKSVFFEAVDNIFGNRPATEPKVLIDSMSSKTDEDNESNGSGNEDGGKDEQEVEEVQENESLSGTNDSNSSRDVVVKKEDRSDVKSIVSSKKKRKRQLDVIQDTMKCLFGCIESIRSNVCCT